MASKKSSPSYKTILIWTGVAFGATAIALGGVTFAAAGYGRLYEGRIFPGVRVLGVRLDGLTPDEARTVLNKAVDEALRDGLRFRFVPSEGAPRDIAIGSTTVATADPDASRDLVRYDLEPAVVAAMTYGRGNNLVFDSLARWSARVRPVALDAGTSIDEERITDALTESVKDVLPPVRDASLDVRWNESAKRADVTVIPEQSGRVLDSEPALRTLRRQAERLRFEPIDLRDREMQPAIRAAEAERAKAGVPALLTHAPFTLTYGADKYVVTPSLLAGWIGVSKENGQPTATLLPDRFSQGLRTLAPRVEKTAQQGSLVIEDGKIKDFTAGTEGVSIDDTATLSAIRDTWKTDATDVSVAIVVTRVEPAISGQDPERLGIKEIIGEGHSNFSGSPTNRRRNIALGVKKVNGTLIPPGGEFSMLQTLGPVTAENGWLPELVIKGNKTEPELGGGLCQIGTTTFRAALGSGLPITERRNHSYRVRYYEPVGTDATIYEPKPDFRFLNDTGRHILIHAYITGDNITYEFWGTEDNRKTIFKGQTDVTDVDDLRPRVFNQTAPPPTKLIETLDLKPGEKKCTEVAHAGADAEFTYAVTYPDGTTKEEVFRSHYRPWQAVCLIGVEKLSEPAPADGVILSPDSAAADAITP